MQTILSGIDTIYFLIIRKTSELIDILVLRNPQRGSQNADFDIKKEEGVHEEDEVNNSFVDAEQTFKTVQEIFKREKLQDIALQKNTVMYANTTDVPLFKEATIEFDGQIEKIPYGEKIVILEPRGRFYNVIWRDRIGWVLRDDIAERVADVYPVFKIGEENLVDHYNTIHVRAILKDEFGLNRSEYALQAGEYVLYKLWQRDITISWPEIRPRVPGLWHKILKGIKDIHMQVSPKVGAIMEYLMDTDIGHLAYVEAVFPDGTILISEVNYPDSGIYSERKLTKNEWIELRPIFIEILK